MDLEYIIASIPIILSHICIPPLSYFNGERIPFSEIRNVFELIYSTVPESFTNENFVTSLLFDASSNDTEIISSENKLDYTRLTHIFVHGNYNHLFDNLISAVLFGSPVFQEFGYQGLYNIYLLGGIFCTLPVLQDSQKLALERLFFRKMTIKSDFIPDSVSKFWHNTRIPHNVSKFLSNIIPKKTCGSSGAVCCLNGVELVLTFRNTFYMFYPSKARKIDQYGNLNSHSTCSDNNDNNASISDRIKNKFTRKQVVALFGNTFNIIRTITFWNSEINSLYSTNSSRNSIENEMMDFNIFEKKVTSLVYINHEAHIQGLIFGVSFGVVFGIIVPFFIRHKNKFTTVVL